MLAPAVAKVVQDVQLARRRLDVVERVGFGTCDRQIFVQSQGTVQLQGANAMSVPSRPMRPEPQTG